MFRAAVRFEPASWKDVSVMLSLKDEPLTETLASGEICLVDGWWRAGTITFHTPWGVTVPVGGRRKQLRTVIADDLVNHGVLRRAEIRSTRMSRRLELWKNVNQQRYDVVSKQIMFVWTLGCCAKMDVFGDALHTPRGIVGNIPDVFLKQLLNTAVSMTATSRQFLHRYGQELGSFQKTIERFETYIEQRDQVMYTEDGHLKRVFDLVMSATNAKLDKTVEQLEVIDPEDQAVPKRGRYKMSIDLKQEDSELEEFWNMGCVTLEIVSGTLEVRSHKDEMNLACRVFPSGWAVFYRKHQLIVSFLTRLNSGKDLFCERLFRNVTCCIFCGSRLTREGSQNQGAGDTCVRKYGSKWIERLADSLGPVDTTILSAPEDIPKDENGIPTILFQYSNVLRMFLSDHCDDADHIEEKKQELLQLFAKESSKDAIDTLARYIVRVPRGTYEDRKQTRVRWKFVPGGFGFEDRWQYKNLEVAETYEGLATVHCHLMTTDIIRCAHILALDDLLSWITVCTKPAVIVDWYQRYVRECDVQRLPGWLYGHYTRVNV
jgi:hypothetical protein